MSTESLPLRDIHLPSPVGIWPLAPGLWLLIATLIVGVAITIFLIQRHRRPTALRQALAEVNRLFETPEISNVQRNQEISLILKKLAVTTYPREHVAGLSGMDWIKWVGSQVEGETLSAQSFEFLRNGAYCVNEQFIADQGAFRTEIIELLNAIGGSKEPFLSKSIKLLTRAHFKSPNRKPRQ